MKESCVHVAYSVALCHWCNVAIMFAIFSVLSFPKHMSTSRVPPWHNICVFIPPPQKQRGGGFVFLGVVVFINYSLFFVFEPSSIHSLILGP